MLDCPTHYYGLMKKIVTLCKVDLDKKFEHSLQVENFTLKLFQIYIIEKRWKKVLEIYNLNVLT